MKDIITNMNRPVTLFDIVVAMAVITAISNLFW